MYQFEFGSSLSSEFRRIARELTGGALINLTAEDGNLHTGIHEARKKLKRMRGLLRLARPVLGKTYKRENAFYRDVARDLSQARDVQAGMETVAKLKAWKSGEIDGLAMARVDQALAERHKAVSDGSDLEEKTAATVARLIDGERRIPGWKIKRFGFRQLATGLASCYAQARPALAKAEAKPSDEQWHMFRKHAKYHYYHMQLMVEAWPEVMAARAVSADRLGDLLGDDHDLTVLRNFLGTSGIAKETKCLLEPIARRQAELRIEALAIARHLFTEDTEQFVDRIHDYWRISRDETLPDDERQTLEKTKRQKKRRSTARA